MKLGVGCALLLGAGGLLCLAAQQGGLAEIQAIADRETRSRRALAFALEQLEIAGKAYQGGDPAAGRQALGRIGAAVDLAEASLQTTGKNARRYPRHFKHAEIRTRDLLGQLQQMQRKLYLGDQGDFDGLIKQIEAANARLLRSLMGLRE